MIFNLLKPAIAGKESPVGDGGAKVREDRDNHNPGPP
jgi:hypothetical protein